MRTCQSCGRENPPDRDFCDCGEYLRWEPTGFMQAVPAEAAAPPAEPAAAPPPPPAAPAGDPTIAELEKLAALKQQGILSDEEFAAAKAKLLGI